MEMKKMISIAIAFSMLAVSFAVVGTFNTNAAFFSDSNTHLNVNAAFPKQYWIGFNSTPGLANLIDTSVPVNADYLFTMQGNYSMGWTNCEVVVEAWYDNGALGGASNYAPAGNNTRNQAFRISYWANNATTMIRYPSPLMEVSTGVTTDIDTGFPYGPADSRNHHIVRIPVHFNAQIRNASACGFASGDVDFDMDQNNALLDKYSWDFSVRIQDRLYTSAGVQNYSEFGINKAVSIVVSGDPSANAPPGSINVAMAPVSSIVYSSNAAYYVNVSIGNLVGPATIAATNVRVRNTNLNATGGNSNMSVAIPFQGAGIEEVIWGKPMAPANNGTLTAGPVQTNYYFGPAVTQLSWWVSVPVGRPEGIYTATITVSIEN